MSDGPEKSLYDKRNRQLSKAVYTLFKWQQELEPSQFEEILRNNLEQVIAANTDDDCSIAMVLTDTIVHEKCSRLSL